MTLEEVVNLPCPFAGQERTDCIDEPSAWANQFRGDVEQALLNSNEPIKPLRREAPSAFRVTAPRPASRARSIHQNQVRLAAPLGKFFQFLGRTKQNSLDGCPRALAACGQLR